MRLEEEISTGGYIYWRDMEAGEDSEVMMSD